MFFWWKIFTTWQPKKRVWEGAQGFFGKKLHQMICSSCIIKLNVLNRTGWDMDNYILF